MQRNKNASSSRVAFPIIHTKNLAVIPLGRNNLHTTSCVGKKKWNKWGVLCCSISRERADCRMLISTDDDRRLVFFHSGPHTGMQKKGLMHISELESCLIKLWKCLLINHSRYSLVLPLVPSAKNSTFLKNLVAKGNEQKLYNKKRKKAIVVLSLFGSGGLFSISRREHIWSPEA